MNWSASNVSSCKVTAPNGDTWTGLQSILGGNVSTPITGETTYTLSCLALDGTTLTKQATVRIIGAQYPLCDMGVQGPVF